jgi:hypothetical protein
MTTLQEKKIWEIIKEMEEEKKSFFSHRAGQNEKEGIYNNGVYDTICRFLPKLKSLLSETGNERKDEGYWHELKSKMIDILFEANGTGSGADDIIDLLKSHSTTLRDEEKKNEPTEGKPSFNDFLALNRKDLR